MAADPLTADTFWKERRSGRVGKAGPDRRTGRIPTVDHSTSWAMCGIEVVRIDSGEVSSMTRAGRAYPFFSQGRTRAIPR